MQIYTHTHARTHTYTHTGLVNKPTTDYYSSSTVIQKVLPTKNLSIIFDFKMAFSKHWHALANKGFYLVCLLLRCFHSRNHELQIRLFNCFVRPILKYNWPVQSCTSFKARYQNY